MKISTKVNSKNNKILNLDKTGIIYNAEHKSAEKVACELETILLAKGFPQVVKYKIPDKKEKFFADNDLGMAFIIGGDGTFLGAARYFAPYGIPLFGINTGRLGFLSQTNPANIKEGIEKIINGNFIIEERLMIKVCHEDKEEYGTALNDVVIKGGEISRTARLFLYINGRHVCDYRADGLIISTPTGSTAYTLSAGGPVVVPELEAFVIVPICPHSLTTRPIVIPADEQIEVRFNVDSSFIYVTNDGQETIKIADEKSILITRSGYKAKLVCLEGEDNGFYSILREKLHWGVSPG